MILRPVAVFGLSAIMTMLAVVYLPPMVLLLPAAFLALVWLHRIRKKRRWEEVAVVFAGSVAALMAFAVWQNTAVVPVQSRIGQMGEVLAAAREVEDTGEDGFVSAVLQVEQWQGQKANFRVYLERCPEMAVGEKARLLCTLEALDENDKNAYYAKGVYAAASYEGSYAYGGESKSLWAILYALRMHLSEILRRYLSAQNGAIAAAMTVGDRTHLEWDLRRLMSRAGISHLLVISGLHVSLLCSVLGRQDSRHYRLRALLSMGIALFLMALTGFTASVCRAGITAILCELAVILVECPDGLTAMAIAGLWMCLPNPYRICDIGMQLSFAATLGVIASASAYERILWKLNEWQGEKPKACRICPVSWAMEHLGRPLLSTGLASVCVVPVLLMHDMAVSGAGILGNLLSMWLVAPILLLGYGVIAAGVLSLAPLYRGMSLLLEVLLRILCKAAEFCAGMPFSRLPLPQSYTCLVLAVLLLLVLLGWARMRWRWLLAAVPVVLLAAMGIGIAFQKDVVELALVGNRASPCLVVSQNAHTAVLFRGGQTNCRSVENYLDRYGLPSPDYVVDLRQEPGDALPDGAKTIVLAGSEGDEVTLWPGVLLQTLPMPQGNLAVITIGGWQMAMSAGKLQLQTPILLDAYGAGQSVQAGIDAKTILTKSSRFKRETAGDAAVYWGDYSPAALVRPERAAIYKGGKLCGTE